MTEPFHYPPEVLSLAIDTIPLLCRSYEDTLLFFRGAGVSDSFTKDLWHTVKNDRTAINKYKIARTILTRLNEQGDATLRERREILKRIVEYEDFSACWPDDQLKAKGRVAELRRVVNVKDSFTRMSDERLREHREHVSRKDEELRQNLLRQEAVEKVKVDLYALFAESHKQKRGTALEGVLNQLFATYRISVRESFSLKGDFGEGIIEQVDGVIEFGHHLYFVEMKWWQEPIGRPEVSEHLVRIYHRPESRALIISASGFTEPAILTCKESLIAGKVVTLCTLQELVMLLERKGDLQVFLKAKVDRTIMEKNPFPTVSV